MKSNAGGGSGASATQGSDRHCALGPWCLGGGVRLVSRGGDGADSQVIAVAFRADGGSPAVTVAYGHPTTQALPPDGDYYVQLVSSADVANLDKVCSAKATACPSPSSDR
jgi:hypothetical protein